MLQQRIALRSGSARVMSVSMKPGATQLTVMLRLPSSCASERRHAGDAGLGRRIVGLAGIAGSANHRGDVDDAAAARLHHAAHDQLGQPEHRLEIGVDDRIPLVVLHAHRQVVAGDAGIVDQDRHGAEALLDLADHGLAGSRHR